MKIRSITTFANPGWPLDNTVFKKLGVFNQAVRPAFEAAGYEVQTTRLATQPFPQLISGSDHTEVLTFAQTIDNSAAAQGYNYTSIGPALPSQPWSYEIIPDIFTATENVFASGVIASEEHGISLPAVNAAAKIIQKCSSLESNGFGNLYFAALVNVNPGAPFFPAAYHDGGPPKFALATEAANLAVEAFSEAKTLLEAKENLNKLIGDHAKNLVKTAETLSDRHGIHFLGIDFTLAPFPEEHLSLGTALERLGIPAVGSQGSLAAAAFLTSTLDQIHFPRVGFCGLMLPVLEDSTLAKRAAENILTVNDLLLYSAVCGTGLDTIPLPGDIPVEHLSALLLDIAALGHRLKKPLTARLMPIPGKSAGDPTDFNFPFFANSRVMDLRASPLSGLLNGSETFHLIKRG